MSLRELAARALRTALHLLLEPPQRAFAHTLDELLQQMYVTPIGSGVVIELQIVPGELVAAEFAASLGADGDGVISEADLAPRLEAIRDAISVRFDGLPVSTRVTNWTIPDGPALIAGAAGLVIILEADAPRGSEAPRTVSVSNEYAPIKGIVQSNVTLPVDSPVRVTKIARAPDGRTLDLEIE